jgi:3-isopropylmalate dehydratase small subunit
MEIKGRAWKFGDDINTDAIIPGRYLNISDPEKLAEHCMEDADPDFVKNVKQGDLIVAGKNFGCGSSREHAPISIKAAGVSCIIAKSFARIFYRNAFNIGLPIFESEEAVSGINTGDTVEVDWDTGKIVNITTGRHFQSQPIPAFLQEMLRDGGLMKHIAKRIKS